MVIDVTTTLLAQHAEARATRQAELASNVANANSPGYIAKDIDFAELVHKHQSVDLLVTNPRHIQGGLHKSKFHLVNDMSGGMKPNGNNVDLPGQMAKLATNQDRYNEILKHYTVANGLIGTALGTGS